MKKYWAIVSLLFGCGGPNMPQSRLPEWWNLLEWPKKDCGALGVKAFERGSFTSTSSMLGFAIDGPGFFALRYNDALLFTRHGEFFFEEGFIVGGRDNQLRLQGFTQDATAPSDLNFELEMVALPPAPTSLIFIEANLDATATSPDYVFTSSVAIYDKLGATHLAQVSWKQTGPRRWSFQAFVDGDSIFNGAPGTFAEIAFGQLDFDESGSLQTYSQQSNFIPRQIGKRQELWFDFGQPLSEGGSGLEGVTQFAAASSTLKIYQNGYSAGELSAIQARSDGDIECLYTNGITRSLGRIAIALFPHPQGLRRLSDHMLSAGAASGESVLGNPNEGGRGGILAYTLEQLPDDSRTCE